MPQVDIINARNFIAALDLAMVTKQLISSQKLKIAGQKDAKSAYRHFMLLVWMSRNDENARSAVVPNKLADAVWHEHLLFTRDYHSFCGNLLGAFIHHEPNPVRMTEKAKRKRLNYTRKLDLSIPKELRFVSEFLPKVIRPPRNGDFGCDCQFDR